MPFLSPQAVILKGDRVAGIKFFRTEQVRKHQSTAYLYVQYQEVMVYSTQYQGVMVAGWRESSSSGQNRFGNIINPVQKINHSSVLYSTGTAY